MASNTIKYEEFERYLQQFDWLQATINQFLKDARMAGLDAPNLDPAQGAALVIEATTAWVDDLKGDHLGFQSFNYRVDLPSSVEPMNMATSEVATLYLFRCFQKVWLRKRFSEGPSKDEEEIRQKHLKP